MQFAHPICRYMISGWMRNDNTAYPAFIWGVAKYYVSNACKIAYLNNTISEYMDG